MRVDLSRACPDTSAVSPRGDGLHCSRCEHAVLDLRHVTERRANELIAAARARDGKVCATLFTDRTGRPSYLLEPSRTRLPVVEAAFVATLASACAPAATHTTAETSAIRVAPQSKQPTPPVPPADDAGVSSASTCAPQADAGAANASGHGRHHPRSTPGRGRRTHPPEEGYGGLLF